MIKVLMPQMGESLAEGTVVRWLKAAGDPVARDEPLFEISTDKVDTDVPAPAAGRLKEILVREGETVNVGTPVALIETGADESQSRSPEPTGRTAAEPRPSDRPPPEESSGVHFKTDHAPQLVTFRQGPVGSKSDGVPRPRAGLSRASGSGGGEPDARRSFSPAVLDAARRGGLPLERLTMLEGSGRGGRLTKRDVDEFLVSRPSSGAAPSGAREEPPPEYLYNPTDEDRIVPMSAARRKIAHHMAWSTRISPHASAFAECDMSRAAGLLAAERQQFRQDVGAPLTYTVLAARSLLAALRESPVFNSSVVGESIVLKPHVHLGIAVALPDTDELIVPVIRRADELSLPGLARAIDDLATRARDRRLRIEDVQGGTFTLTNPGMFGGITGTPILSQPQVGILGMGAITKRAVVVGDAIAIRPMMTLVLTFDHRAADGMQAFKLLERVRHDLADPKPVGE